MRAGRTGLDRTGIDAAALKPTECDLPRAADLPFDLLTVDYEGREHVPRGDVLAALSADRDVRLTVPVRADGFDPLGDDALSRALPEGVGRVYVAGHPAYLTDEERQRAIAPRLGAALSADPDGWVGTEGIERLALATGATQFELLSGGTERSVRALRAAGFDGGVAVYAPAVLTDDADDLLDALGAYVARRGRVAEVLPPGAPTDSASTGRAREVLLAACREYALVGSEDAVGERIAELRAAGVDRVVGYPARGPSAFR